MIARKVNLHPDNVRKWIRNFNKFGIDGIAPKKVGRKLIIKKEIKDKIVRIALTKPNDIGLYFSNWSLRKIKAYLEKEKIVKISHTQLRKILIKKG
jgi:transposase